MTPSLLVFISIFILSLIWSALSYGISYNGFGIIITNEMVAERTMGLLLALCIITWGIYLIFLLNFLCPMVCETIVSIFGHFIHGIF